MPASNQVFFSTVKGARARFYLADFHVHSPGSTDYITLDGKQRPLHGDPVEHERLALAAFPVDAHYEALVAHRNAVFNATCSPDQDSSAILAITDHNVCRYACALAKHAWNAELRKKNKLFILPGMELTVTFSAFDSDSATVHLLTVFPPETNEMQIFLAVKEASGIEWKYGRPIPVTDLAKFVNSLRHHEQYPAIVIAAHAGSAKGIQKESRNMLLSRLETDILRLQFAVEHAEAEDRSRIEADLSDLMKQHQDKDGIALEVLKLLGQCGFDAIQVALKEHQHHYRRLHRCNRELGRAVPIISSDAHRIDHIFHANPAASKGQHPFVKLPIPPFETNTSHDFLTTIRSNGLRYGETRFSCVPPGRVTAWIEAIEIIPDSKDAAGFWPFQVQDQDGAPSFTLHFSQNLNCLIGGRGSGKSAALEAIAFSTCPAAYNERELRKQDWYKRAVSTLKGCRIRVCWRILNAINTELKKSTLFVSRYFDPQHDHSPAHLTNVDGKELHPSVWQYLGVEFFRLHDIEAAALPERLRGLFDRFCGEEVFRLSNEIDNLRKELIKQRSAMLQTARRLADVTASHSPLREYVRRKAAYNDANRPDISSQFEELDSAESSEKVASDSLTSWNAIVIELSLSSHKEKVATFFTQLREQTTSQAIVLTEGSAFKTHSEIVVSERYQLKQQFRPLLPLLATAEGDVSPSSAIASQFDRLDASLAGITTALHEASLLFDQTHKECREALAARGFPKGAADRQAKKRALDEAESKLNDYRTAMAEWESQAAERMELFSLLEEKCKERTQLRRTTADGITSRLASDLDQKILKIEADAQPMNDKSEFSAWLETRIDWSSYKYKSERLKGILQTNNLLPSELRDTLLDFEAPVDRLVVSRPRAQDGRIDASDARGIIEALRPWTKLGTESTEELDPDFVASLPEEVRNGLIAFRYKSDGKSLFIDDVLQLDEVVLDDQPIIRLNDRPGETDVMKPLDRLSQGQRCSAILPILLLTGNSPLVIDQPEDNLDNRLVRQVIVNVLASIKLRRQVIVATHNPNLPVLGDAEQVIALRAVEDDQCLVQAAGSLDDDGIVHQVTEIMEGGREAFQYRQSIYEVQWSAGAANE